MKILNLGLDNSILKKNSQLRARVLDYGILVDKYFVIVPSREYIQEDLNDKISIFGSGGGKKAIQFLKIYFLAKRLIQKNNFDIISVQDQYYLALLGLVLGRKYKIAVELQIHGFEKFKGIRKLIARLVIKRASGIRVVSQRLRKKLINEFNVDSEKITVVPIYAELRMQNLESRIKNNNKFIFLTVSRFVAIKNIEMQIKAMRELVKKNSNVELWLVGDGSLRKNYKLQIKNYKLEDHVKFLGWIDNKEELNKIYAQTDCFLLTSDSEGWGVAVVDAASHSLPIIMTDVGLAGEVIKNNESGIIIPVRDQKALESAMIKIIKDQNLREILGKNARQAIAGLPNKEETLNLYLESWRKTQHNSNTSNYSL